MTGVWALTRFALRKDRAKLPIWLFLLAAAPIGIAASFSDLYPDRASRIPFAADITGSPGLLATTGPAVDLLTLGGLTTWRAMGTTCAFAGIMSLLLVLRHTRADEESGRLELLRSTPIERSANLSAALLTALIANVLLAGLIAVGLVAVGLPVAGSVGFGCAVGACGLVFTGVAAVAAQLTEVTRAATGIASGVLACAYLLRAAGDSAGDSAGLQWLSWFSPLAWSQRLRPFGGENVQWWTFVLSLGASVLLVLAAYRLADRRDFGSGILAARPGPSRASGLSSSFALAWRLQRGTLIGWSAGFAVLGLVVGALGQSVGDLVADSPQLADVLTALGGAQSVVDSYFGTVFGVCGLLGAAYVVSALLRLNAEESEGRAELLLGTPVGRLPWAVGHLVIALAGAGVLMLVVGLFTSLSYGVGSGDVGEQLPRAVLAALSQMFAVWVFAGIGLLLFGAFPSAALVAWLAVGLAAALELLGPALDLPQAVMDLSPFTHLPALPGGDLTVVPHLWLLALTAALTAGGLLTLKRRDLS